MEALARLILRRRKAVIAVWIVLTLFGGFAAGQVSKRWFQSFSIPGYSAYEANQRMLKTFGSGENAPLVAVVTATTGDVTKLAGVQAALEAAAAAAGPDARSSSFFSTGSPMYVSADRHMTFEEIVEPGTPGFTFKDKHG